MSDVPAIFTGTDESAPAPASPLGEPLSAPANEQEFAELVGAAHFLDRADSRYAETQAVAEEVFGLLGGNPFAGQGDPDGDRSSSAPQRDEHGRFMPSNGKYVPHGALERERVKRKELQEKLRESELRAAKVEERLSTLSELMQAAGIDTAAQPQRQQHDQSQQQQSRSGEFVDPEVDVFAAVQQLQQQNSRLQAERDEQRFLETAKADMAQFVKQAPDFFDGVQYLAKARDRELEIMGMADPKERVHQIAREQKHLMVEAFKVGKSASALLYELARQRGFTGGGRPPQSRPNVSYDPKIVEQLQQTQRAQSLNTSLSGAGGTGGAGLTVQQIADMPEDEFHKLIQKMGGLGSPAVQRAFGGQ